jgi:hypothetical protein
MKVCFYTEGHLGDFIIGIPFFKLLIEKYPNNEYYQYIYGSDGTVYPDIFIRTVPNLIPTENIDGDIVIPTWFCNPIYVPLHLNTEEVLNIHMIWYRIKNISGNMFMRNTDSI